MLAQAWEEESTQLQGAPVDEARLRQLIASIQASRVSAAVLEVAQDPAAAELLKRIAKNPLNLSDREQSRAKDPSGRSSFCPSSGPRVSMRGSPSPPDIVVRLDGDEMGVACKKVYSERGVEAQVRKGCTQLSSFRAGVVALNLDQFIPFDTIFSAGTRSQASDMLHRVNLAFLERNAGRRFLLEGRCDGLLLCLTAEADLQESRVRVNAVGETMTWAIQGAPVQSSARLRRFAERLSASVGTI